MRRQPRQSYNQGLLGIPIMHCHASQGSTIQSCSWGDSAVDLASCLQEANSKVLLDASHLSSAPASASALGRGNRSSMEIDESTSLPWSQASQPVVGRSGPRPQGPAGRLSTHWLLMRPKPNKAVSSPSPSMPCLCLLGLCSYLAVYTSSFIFCSGAWSES